MFCTAPELIRINIIHIFNDVFTMLVICICSPSLSVKSLCQIPIECVEATEVASWDLRDLKKKKKQPGNQLTSVRIRRGKCSCAVEALAIKYIT